MGGSMKTFTDYGPLFYKSIASTTASGTKVDIAAAPGAGQAYYAVAISGSVTSTGTLVLTVGDNNAAAGTDNVFCDIRTNGIFHFVFPEPIRLATNKTLSYVLNGTTVSAGFIVTYMNVKVV